MPSVMYNVNHQTQAEEQSCWAAAAAMLVDTTESEILARFPEFGDDGVQIPEIHYLANELNLTILEEACREAAGWWELLERGPVMIGVPDHFMVVSGINYDDATQEWQLFINDPRASGPDWWVLASVEASYESNWSFSPLLQR